MVVRFLVTLVVTLVLHGTFVLYVRPYSRARHTMPPRSRVAADYSRLPLASGAVSIRDDDNWFNGAPLE